jgi:YD repeat-containing protein
MRLWKESPISRLVVFRELRFPKPLRPRPPYLKSACNRIGVKIRKIIIEDSDTTVVKYTYDGADLLFEKDDNDAVQIRYLLSRVTARSDRGLRS